MSTRASTAGATIPEAALMPTPIATTPAIPSRMTIERGNAPDGGTADVVGGARAVRGNQRHGVTIGTSAPTGVTHEG